MRVPALRQRGNRPFRSFQEHRNKGANISTNVHGHNGEITSSDPSIEDEERRGVGEDKEHDIFFLTELGWPPQEEHPHSPQNKAEKEQNGKERTVGGVDEGGWG